MNKKTESLLDRFRPQSFGILNFMNVVGAVAEIQIIYI